MGFWGCGGQNVGGALARDVFCSEAAATDEPPGGGGPTNDRGGWF